ncbi:MAG: flagellar hook-length control protein FliK [Tepidimonas taiwanensis]|nr:flagellar hook-length control protein FliK [Tepidimonas taiwanensis]
MKTEATATPTAHAHAHGTAHAGRAQPATPETAGGDPFADLLAGLFAETDGPRTQDEKDTTTATADGATPPGIAPWMPSREGGQPVADDALASDNVLASDAAGRFGLRDRAEGSAGDRVPLPGLTGEIAAGSATVSPMGADPATAGDPASADAAAGHRPPADPLRLSTPVDGAQPASAQPCGAWVSTVARGKGRSGPAVRGIEANARDGDATAEAATPATGQGRHGERSTAAALMAPPMIAVAMAETVPPRLSPDKGSRDRPGDDVAAKGAAGWGDAPAGVSIDAPPTTEAAAAWQQALSEAFDSIGAQISLWSAGKAQRASFSVEEGLDDPLAVEVTVSDGVAQLSFRTDDGTLRQMIQAQAPGALADALARAGLALGQLDVGAHTARERQAPPADTLPAKRATLTIAAGEEGTTGRGLARAVRSAGGAGLDVYA